MNVVDTKLYLAGPMTGLPELNYPTFYRVARMMRAAGFTVTNPAENVLPRGAGAVWSDYMRRSVVQVAHAQGLAVLTGWKQSRGARLEVHLAKELGVPVYRWEEWMDRA